MMGIWLLGAILAHQGTAFEPTETAVLAGKHFALMKVVAATEVSTEESRTRVQLVDAIDGAPPAQAEVVQRGPHQHVLQAQSLVLMPLSQRGGTWAYLAQTRRPLTVEAKQRRQAVAFVKRWRSTPSKSPEALAPEWINLLSHPAQVARQIGHEALVQFAPRLKATLTTGQLDGIAQPLTDPGVPATEHIARIRMLGLLGGRDGARRIARVFDQLASDRVRRMAVGVLGRFAVKEAKTVLRRCAQTARGSLKARCVRVVQSIDGPTP